MVLKLYARENHLEGLLIHRVMSLTSRISESAGLGQGLRTHISDKFPDDSDAAGLGTHFENHEAVSHCLSWLLRKFVFFFVGITVIKNYPFKPKNS